MNRLFLFILGSALFFSCATEKSSEKSIFLSDELKSNALISSIHLDQEILYYYTDSTLYWYKHSDYDGLDSFVFSYDSIYKAKATSLGYNNLIEPGLLSNPKSRGRIINMRILESGNIWIHSELLFPQSNGSKINMYVYGFAWLFNSEKKIIEAEYVSASDEWSFNNRQYLIEQQDQGPLLKLSLARNYMSTKGGEKIQDIMPVFKRITLPVSDHNDEIVDLREDLNFVKRDSTLVSSLQLFNASHIFMRESNKLYEWHQDSVKEIWHFKEWRGVENALKDVLVLGEKDDSRLAFLTIQFSDRDKRKILIANPRKQTVVDTFEISGTNFSDRIFKIDSDIVYFYEEHNEIKYFRKTIQ